MYLYTMYFNNTSKYNPCHSVNVQEVRNFKSACTFVSFSIYFVCFVMYCPYVTWMQSFPLIFLWFIYQNLSNSWEELWNNTHRYEILHTLNLGCSFITLGEPCNNQRLFNRLTRSTVVLHVYYSMFTESQQVVLSMLYLGNVNIVNTSLFKYIFDMAR